MKRLNDRVNDFLARIQNFEHELDWPLGTLVPRWQKWNTAEALLRDIGRRLDAHGFQRDSERAYALARQVRKALDAQTTQRLRKLAEELLEEPGEAKRRTLH